MTLKICEVWEAEEEEEEEEESKLDSFAGFGVWNFHLE